MWCEIQPTVFQSTWLCHHVFSCDFLCYICTRCKSPLSKCLICLSASSSSVHLKLLILSLGNVAGYVKQYLFSFLNVLLALFGCFCFYNKARLSSVGPLFVFGVFFKKSSVFKFSIWLKVLLDDINNNHLISVLVMNLWFKLCGVTEGTIRRWVQCGEQQYSGFGDQTDAIPHTYSSISSLNKQLNVCTW